MPTQLPPLRAFNCRQEIPALHDKATELPAICRARGITIAEAHALVAEPASGAAQGAAIDLAANDELRALTAVIDRALSDTCSYSPIVLARAVLDAGYRR